MRHSLKKEKTDRTTPQHPSGHEDKPARSGKKSPPSHTAGASGQAANQKEKLEELIDRDDLSERLFSDRNLK
jgi:hypothetical protein